MASQLHIVFMEVSATGHLNPALPLMKELTGRGCKVTCFVEDKFREVVESAGAVQRRFRYPGSSESGWQIRPLDEAGVAKYVPEGTPAEEYGDKTSAFAYWTEMVLPALLEDLLELRPRPSAVVYDPFVLPAPVAAHVLGIPAIGLLTMPGPGVFVRDDSLIEQQEAQPWVAGPRGALLEAYGVDVLEHGMMMEAYSPTLNLVTTIDELFAAPATACQRRRFGRSPFLCVGPLVDPQVKRIANVGVGGTPTTSTLDPSTPQLHDDVHAGLPWGRIDDAVRCGRQVVFISLGTVATGGFWSIPFGFQGRANGLAEVTGRDFCQHVWRVCYEALGDDDRYLVVLAVGTMADALQGLPPAPRNVLLRAAVPQLELLPRCGAFVTHGGANSMHEGLLAGVPLAVVPIFGDQPANARTVERCGAGLAFHRPLEALTPAALRRAVEDVESNQYREAAATMSATLRRAGGVKLASGAILEAAAAAEARRWAAVRGA